MLVSLTLALLILFPAASLCRDVYLKLCEQYVRTTKLSRKGVDAGGLEELLASAVDSIKSGDYGRASEVLSEVERSLSELESRAGTVALTKNLVKYGTAAAMLSIPIITYPLLTRLYFYLWYTTRKSWVVANERYKWGGIRGRTRYIGCGVGPPVCGCD